MISRGKERTATVMRKIDLLQGSITKGILIFSIPMIVGNMLQQMYNVADTFIVGRFLGAEALAAVGSAYTLMVFLTSVILGLCMGSGAVFAIRYGEGNENLLKNSIFLSFVMIGVITIVVNVISFVFLDSILYLLQVPSGVYDLMRDYLQIIFVGLSFTFLYNFVASLLRAMGNSFVPLVFLSLAAMINVMLDVYFIVTLKCGVRGAAWATVIAQVFSAAGIFLYALIKVDCLRIQRRHMRIDKSTACEVFGLSMLTCMQQSVMNFGILMIQGLVNSFGTMVMAAFAIAVKVDSFAYMPIQDFGNAVSVFVAQNHGANQVERIKQGMRRAFCMCMGFSLFSSIMVCAFAKPLMMLFVNANEVEIISIGVQYLRIEGACYIGIGCLFLLYGYYRAIKKPVMSLVLTIISLGTRVMLAYTLSSIAGIGFVGIWWAIPIGWLLADMVGFWFMLHLRRRKGTGKLG